MNTPKKKYDFENFMLFAFTRGIEAGQNLKGCNDEKEIIDAKEQFCSELHFEYFSGKEKETLDDGHARQ